MENGMQCLNRSKIISQLNLSSTKNK